MRSLSCSGLICSLAEFCLCQISTGQRFLLPLGIAWSIQGKAIELWYFYTSYRNRTVITTSVPRRWRAPLCSLQVAPWCWLKVPPFCLFNYKYLLLCCGQKAFGTLVRTGKPWKVWRVGSGSFVSCWAQSQRDFVSTCLVQPEGNLDLAMILHLRKRKTGQNKVTNTSLCAICHF